MIKVYIGIYLMGILNYLKAHNIICICIYIGIKMKLTMKKKIIFIINCAPLYIIYVCPTQFIDVSIVVYFIPIISTEKQTKFNAQYVKLLLYILQVFFLND